MDLSGLIASIALLLNLLIVLAVLITMEAVLTLPGMAGLLLTVGMAVDANVIIFERIREEIKIRENILAAINAGLIKDTIQIQKLWKIDKIIKPNIKKQIIKKKIKSWKNSVKILIKLNY